MLAPKNALYINQNTEKYIEGGAGKIIEVE